MHGRPVPDVLRRVDGEDEELAATDARFEGDAELAVHLVGVDALDDGGQGGHIGKVHRCRVVEDVPPLPVGIVGSREVAEDGVRMLDARSDNHRVPVEHDRVPEVAGEMRLTAGTTVGD